MEPRSGSTDVGWSAWLDGRCTAVLPKANKAESQERRLPRKQHGEERTRRAIEDQAKHARGHKAAHDAGLTHKTRSQPSLGDVPLGVERG